MTTMSIVPKDRIARPITDIRRKGAIWTVFEQCNQPPLPTSGCHEVRRVPGFSAYAVSAIGDCWSCKNTGWRQLKTGPDENGYPRVMVFDGAKRRLLRVHQLVLFAFVGPCPDGMECCHNDGDPSNCRASNLRWDTARNNSLDKIVHGTQPLIFTDERVIELRNQYDAGGISIHKMATINGVVYSTMFKLLRRITYSHLS